MTINMMLPTIRKAVKYTLNGNYKSEVEDLIQEICLKAYLKMDKFDATIGSIEAWVYSLSVNHVRDFFDKQKRNQWIELNLPSSKKIKGVIIKGFDPKGFNQYVTSFYLQFYIAAYFVNL